MTITGKIRTTLAVAAAAVAVMTVASPAAPAEAAVGSISPASLSVSAPSNGGELLGSGSPLFSLKPERTTAMLRSPPAAL